jgi:hypothetical protein
MRRMIAIVQGSLQAFIGIGAVISGGMLFLAPDGSLMRMPLELLIGSPFKNFLIPGLILFLFIGILPLITAVLSFLRHRWAGYASGVSSLGLIIWIFTEVSMIGGGHWLQNLYFALGILGLSLAFLQIERSLK